MYIALDIETTGFDAGKDQIIEIAAIKFDGDAIIDRFETLLNPGIPIPPMVSHITGIRDEDLTEAPLLETVRESFMRFMGEDPIVGHNIPFDVTFLQQQGFPLKNPLYDTLILTGILFPNLPSYSLDTLTRLFKIEHTQKHRAMSDTDASRLLFLKLQHKIAAISPHAREEITSLLQSSTWPLKTLFLSPGLPTSKTAEKQELSPEEQGGTIAPPSELNLESLYHPETLSAIIPGYEERPSQRRMSEILLEGFRKNKNLLVEAGTGSGKSLAYLLTGALWSVENGEKIVISTYTHTLQQQLLEKDVPLVQKILGKPFTVAVLKGRRHYLSRERLNLLKRKSPLDHDETAFLLKIILWLEESQSGDLTELHLQNKEKVLVDEICCQEDLCLHSDWKYQEGCYLLKARERAELADLIIVNHALLLQNEQSEVPLLPGYARLIVDEAHQLEEVITSSFTITLSINAFLRPFQKIDRLLGAIPGLLSRLHQFSARVEIFFGLLGIYLEKELSNVRTEYFLNLNPSHLESHEFQKIKAAAENIAESGLEILKAMEEKSDGLEPGDRELLRGCINDAHKKIGDLKKSILSAPDNQVMWLLKTLEGSVNLKCAPLNIGAYAQQLLFQKCKSVLLTSATLTTNSNFNYIRDQLYLENFEEYILPSHFKYPDQVKIVIAEDLPEPATEGYFLSCCEVISAAVKKNGGRTLVLFTSKKALAATFHKVAPELKKEGINILGQNMSGGRGKILEHFKDEPGSSAIFGTSSFWEGVDLKGDLLTCVIMQKLPFDPPDDPLVAARSKKYTNAFDEYLVPRAILRFKQGFGRLIRTSKDTGSIILLDTRIVQKSYGPKFLSSLPEGIRIEYAGKDRVAEKL